MVLFRFEIVCVLGLFVTNQAGVIKNRLHQNCTGNQLTLTVTTKSGNNITNEMETKEASSNKNQELFEKSASNGKAMRSKRSDDNISDTDLSSLKEMILESQRMSDEAAQKEDYDYEHKEDPIANYDDPSQDYEEALLSDFVKDVINMDDISGKEDPMKQVAAEEEEGDRGTAFPTPQVASSEMEHSLQANHNEELEPERSGPGGANTLEETATESENTDEIIQPEDHSEDSIVEDINEHSDTGLLQTADDYSEDSRPAKTEDENALEDLVADSDPANPHEVWESETSQEGNVENNSQQADESHDHTPEEDSNSGENSSKSDTEKGNTDVTEDEFENDFQQERDTSKEDSSSEESDSKSENEDADEPLASTGKSEENKWEEWTMQPEEDQDENESPDTSEDSSRLGENSPSLDTKNADAEDNNVNSQSENQTTETQDDISKKDSSSEDKNPELYTESDSDTHIENTELPKEDHSDEEGSHITVTTESHKISSSEDENQGGTEEKISGTENVENRQTTDNPPSVNQDGSEEDESKTLKEQEINPESDSKNVDDDIVHNLEAVCKEGESSEGCKHPESSEENLKRSTDVDSPENDNDPEGENENFNPAVTDATILHDPSNTAHTPTAIASENVKQPEGDSERTPTNIVTRNPTQAAFTEVDKLSTPAMEETTTKTDGTPTTDSMHETVTKGTFADTTVNLPGDTNTVNPSIDVVDHPMTRTSHQMTDDTPVVDSMHDAVTAEPFANTTANLLEDTSMVNSSTDTTDNPMATTSHYIEQETTSNTELLSPDETVNTETTDFTETPTLAEVVTGGSNMEISSTMASASATENCIHTTAYTEITTQTTEIKASEVSSEATDILYSTNSSDMSTAKANSGRRQSTNFLNAVLIATMVMLAQTIPC